jgi:hypothetical protein
MAISYPFFQRKKIVRLAILFVIIALWQNFAQNKRLNQDSGSLFFLLEKFSQKDEVTLEGFNGQKQGKINK